MTLAEQGKYELAKQAFTQALQSLGADVALTVFPNTDHTLTDDMRLAGCDALAAATG